MNRNKRLSKDDSELLPATSNLHSSRSNGLKGRFKRALAFTPPGALEEQDGESKGKGREEVSASQSGEGVVTPKPKSRLFSGKFNASTDNISLQSTVSSASVMIRKLGSIGKLARRNSLMGITGMFNKDKNKEKGEGASTSKKGRKADKADASVSHVTVELDRGFAVGEDEALSGLSPAALVARQHTLKSNAEAAARKLKEQQAASTPTNGVPSPWEKNTSTKHGTNDPAIRRIREDGTWEGSDNESGEGGYEPTQEGSAEGLAEEEATDDETWAIGLRRSIEKIQKPGKAVIKSGLLFTLIFIFSNADHLVYYRSHRIRSRATFGFTKSTIRSACALQFLPDNHFRARSRPAG